MAGHDPRGTRFESAGDGPPLVLVHGLGLNHALWRWLLPALTPHYRVVRYDLLGHGDSREPPPGLTMADFVVQLDNLVRHLGLERFALVGFSLGGLIAESYALAHPARVAALGVLHSAYDRSAAERAAIRERVALARRAGPAATIGPALERWFTAGFAARHPEVLEEVRATVTANDPAAFAAAYHVLAEADAGLAAEVRAIACPTLVVTGTEDHGNSPAMAARLAAVLPAAECAILPGLRHMALAEDPAAMQGVLLPFLGRAYGRTPA